MDEESKGRFRGFFESICQLILKVGISNSFKRITILYLKLYLGGLLRPSDKNLKGSHHSVSEVTTGIQLPTVGWPFANRIVAKMAFTDTKFEYVPLSKLFLQGEQEEKYARFVFMNNVHKYIRTYMHPCKCSCMLYMFTYTYILIHVYIYV